MIGAALLIVAGTMVVIGVVLEVLAAAVAPFGYQDETGFHVGTPEAGKEEGFAWTNPS